MRARPVTVVALDIGGSSVKAGQVTDGRPVGEVAVTPWAESGPADQLIGVLAAAIRGVAAGAGPVRVAAAAPDPFDHAAGVSRMTHKFAALHGLALAPLLAGTLGRPLEIRWCNDAAAAVAGEAVAGAGAGYHRVLGVTLGTGLGVALVRGGVVVERVGEVIVGDLWSAALADGRSADSAFSARALLRAVDAGTAAQFGTELGGLLAPVVAAAGVEVIVVGGGGAGSLAHIADALTSTLAVPVERFRLGRWGALVGAVQLCWPGARQSAEVRHPDG